jgi:hypothetical protein
VYSLVIVHYHLQYNKPLVPAAFTDVIFCKWHANIDELDDEDMQQCSLMTDGHKQ